MKKKITIVAIVLLILLGIGAIIHFTIGDEINSVFEDTSDTSSDDIFIGGNGGLVNAGADTSTGWGPIIRPNN